MTFNGFFRGLGDIFQWTFQFLQADAIGNIFNYSLIVLGFVVYTQFIVSIFINSFCFNGRIRDLESTA